MDQATDRLRDRLMCLYENGKIDAALACTKKIVILYPTNMNTFRWTIDGLERIGRIDQAIEWCDMAIKADSLSSEFYLKKIYLLSKGRVDEIPDCYNKLIELYPTHSTICAPPKSFVWSCLITQEEKAIVLCERLLAMELKECEAFYIHMAKYNILMKLQRPCDAWKFLDEVIKSNRYQRLRPKYSCMKESLANKIQSVETKSQGSASIFYYAIIFLMCYFGLDWGFKRCLLFFAGCLTLIKCIEFSFCKFFEGSNYYYQRLNQVSRQRVCLWKL